MRFRHGCAADRRRQWRRPRLLLSAPLPQPSRRLPPSSSWILLFPTFATLAPRFPPLVSPSHSLSRRRVQPSALHRKTAAQISPPKGDSLAVQASGSYSDSRRATTLHQVDIVIWNLEVTASDRTINRCRVASNLHVLVISAQL